jgi:cell division protein FtsB
MSGRRKLLWAAVALAGVLAVFSIGDSRGFRHYLRMQQDVEGREARNAQLGERNRAMVREIEALRQDPAAIEQAAREELGFIKPGEVIIHME